MEKTLYSELARLPFYEDFTVCISVIVPVWNPGPGIMRCIESLRAQTLKDIEIIFVDDRGTDDSMDKVYDAAKKDLRIRILRNKSNIGSGDSRNRGIEVARGKYLSFVDPDDYIAPDFLEILYTEASHESFDIVKGSVIYETKDGSHFPGRQNTRIRRWINQGKPLFTLFTFEHYSAIYRRQLLLTSNARYGTSHRAQDHIFLLKACHAAKLFELKDEAHYYSCERDNSAMKTMDAKSLQGCADAVTDQVDYVLDSLEHDENTEMFLINMFTTFLREYERYDCIPDMKEEAIRYLDSLRSQLLRIPYCDNLAQHSYSLRVLRDYGVGLPMTPYPSYQGENDRFYKYAKLLKRWSDFSVTHPDEREACNESMAMIYANIRQYLNR